MTEFELDKQTKKDLGIFSNSRNTNSILSFYDETKTLGGKNFLIDLMNNPIADINKLNQRTELIKFLADTDFDLKLNYSQLDYIEHYKRLGIAPLPNTRLDALFQDLSYRIKPTNDYYIIKTGIQHLINLLVELKVKMVSLNKNNLPNELNSYQEYILEIINNHDFKPIYNKSTIKRPLKTNKLDNLFRKKYKNEISKIIEIVYSLDAFVSIAKISKLKNLAFPTYSNSKISCLYVEDLYHPLLEKAIPNTINIKSPTNLCFLTGPNMAGKSTFLKSVGLSIYLAHLGFPIPATKMTTSIYNGIITTINLSDDINLGHSHFYSEVNRIKETLIKIKQKKNLFIIFDELFRGTNVKDAFDGSLLITKSFANISESTFFISTHVTEVAEKLINNKNIKFKYFDSELNNDIPNYNYKLKNGISNERLGMHILKKEKIMELLETLTNN
ncbi:MutS-related protein [Aestuariibaculum suncheonense]|uniref:DNA mismatch repair proteins mutS family domain-containing protein n=1 Tax=Aestuariibaculum suncheonense TaxID=1028745 RepID=A0A8J6UCN0_9FLAO|nr:hypothetical protein [Aestuariibaculum suncheonense]MBD0836775.1 hypothetical protein [Aestuariibaculum suncheonense]